MVLPDTLQRHTGVVINLFWLIYSRCCSQRFERSKSSGASAICRALELMPFCWPALWNMKQSRPGCWAGPRRSRSHQSQSRAQRQKTQLGMWWLAVLMLCCSVNTRRWSNCAKFEQLWCACVESEYLIFYDFPSIYLPVIFSASSWVVRR